MGDFNILTYNVKGLWQTLKRNTIFKYISEKLNSGIAFFQETHSIVSDVDIWRKEWDGDMYFSHSWGVAVAFSKDFKGKILKCDCDEDGRLQVITLKMNDKHFLIANIYNENTETKQIIILKRLN